MSDRKAPITIGDEITAEDAIPCPHCGKANDEADWWNGDWWNGDYSDLIQKIIREDIYYDAEFECLHCRKSFKFHAYAIRHYWVKKDQ